MSLARGSLSTRLLIILVIVAAAALAVSCSGDDATTTTTTGAATGISTTATTGQTATTVGVGTETSTATSTAESTSTTQSPTASGELPQTPPSIAGGSTPPQPGEEYAKQLPKLEQAAKEEPKDLEALAKLAVAYYQTQAFAKAEETYKKMIDIKDQAEYHNNLANVYRDWGKADQAVAEYQAAIEIDPSSALWYGNLAAMYMMSGDIAKAREVAQAGIEKTTGEARAQLERLLESFS